VALPEQAFSEGALLTPPFKGERHYVAAADILRSIDAALRPDFCNKGQMSVEFRQVVDGGLQIVSGQGSDAPVRLRWFDDDTTQIFSLKRVAAGAPRVSNALPPYVLQSMDYGDVIMLNELGGHSNLFECAVDAGKRLHPAADTLSKWLVRSVQLNLCRTPQPWARFILVREALRGAMMRWNVTDLEGCRVISVVSVLVQVQLPVN
jgi:hypothetical protein